MVSNGITKKTFLEKTSNSFFKHQKRSKKNWSEMQISFQRLFCHKSISEDKFQLITFIWEFLSTWLSVFLKIDFNAWQTKYNWKILHSKLGKDGKFLVRVFLNLSIDPGLRVCDVGVNSRNLIFSATDSPGNDSNLSITFWVILQRTNQWTSSIALQKQINYNSEKIWKGVWILYFLHIQNCDFNTSYLHFLEYGDNQLIQFPLIHWNWIYFFRKIRN